ncbi:MAG: hypothetical protein U9O78_00100 [Patescibacteria group bacterium]|nr:hypothetical protein [Patescibacteria group bacterium]
MINEFKKHKLSYGFLILFLTVTSFLFLAAWPDRRYQRYLILLMSTFYFLWGVIIHFKRKDLNLKIFIEYFGVAVFAGLLLFLVTV